MTRSQHKFQAALTTAPVMADLHAWLEATQRRISSKSDLAKAIRYTLRSRAR